MTSSSSGEPGLNAVIKPFQAAFPNVNVKPEFANLGTPAVASQIASQLQAGNAPDAFTVYSGNTGVPSVVQLAKAGDLLDLSDTPAGKANPSWAAPATTYNGKTYEFLIGVQFETLIYNTAQFTKFGLTPPATLADLANTCKIIHQKAPKDIPLSFAGGNPAIMAQVISMLALNEGIDAAWNSKRLQGTTSFAASVAWGAALQDLILLKNASCFSASAVSDDKNDVISQMTSGQAFMAVDGSTRFAGMKKVDPNLPIAMVPFPGRTATATRLMISPATNEVVNAHAKNKAAALAFVNFIARPATQTIWEKAAGYGEFPAGLLNTPQQWPSQFKSLSAIARKKQLQSAVSWPTAGTSSALGMGGVGLLTGKSTVAQVLGDADASWGK